MKTIREWMSETDSTQIAACLSARLLSPNQELINESAKKQIDGLVDQFLAIPSKCVKDSARLGIFVAPQWRKGTFSIEPFVYPQKDFYRPFLPKTHVMDASVEEVLDSFVMETPFTMAFLPDLLAAVIDTVLLGTQSFADYCLGNSSESSGVEENAKQEQIMKQREQSRPWLDTIQKTTESLNWFLEKSEARCAQRWLRERTPPAKEKK